MLTCAFKTISFACNCYRGEREREVDDVFKVMFSIKIVELPKDSAKHMN